MSLDPLERAYFSYSLCFAQYANHYCSTWPSLLIICAQCNTVIWWGNFISLLTVRSNIGIVKSGKAGLYFFSLYSFHVIKNKCFLTYCTEYWVIVTWGVVPQWIHKYHDWNHFTWAHWLPYKFAHQIPSLKRAGQWSTSLSVHSCVRSICKNVWFGLLATFLIKKC